MFVLVFFVRSGRKLGYGKAGEEKEAPVYRTLDIMKETQNADTFNDIPLDSSTCPVYDDPDEDAGSGSESLDSYEVPIPRWAHA